MIRQRNDELAHIIIWFLYRFNIVGKKRIIRSEFKQNFQARSSISRSKGYLKCIFKIILNVITFRGINLINVNHNQLK